MEDSDYIYGGAVGDGEPRLTVNQVAFVSV